MREIRLSGSEGGGGHPASPYLYRSQAGFRRQKRPVSSRQRSRRLEVWPAKPLSPRWRQSTCLSESIGSLSEAVNSLPEAVNSLSEAVNSLSEAVNSLPGVR
jgi:hypothetical protein